MCPTLRAPSSAAGRAARGEARSPRHQGKAPPRSRGSRRGASRSHLRSAMDGARLPGDANVIAAAAALARFRLRIRPSVSVGLDDELLGRLALAGDAVRGIDGAPEMAREARVVIV